MPNVITVVRLCCIPVFLWLLFGRDNRAGAAWLLGALGATDWVDGYVARRFGQVTELGKMLDPTADRLLFIVGIGAIIVDGSAPLWFCMARRSSARPCSGRPSPSLTLFAGMKRFDVTLVGQGGHVPADVRVPGLHARRAGLPGPRRLPDRRRGSSCIPGLVLSYYTALTYVPMMQSPHRLRAGRHGGQPS